MAGCCQPAWREGQATRAWGRGPIERVPDQEGTPIDPEGRPPRFVPWRNGQAATTTAVARLEEGGGHASRRDPAPGTGTVIDRCNPPEAAASPPRPAVSPYE